MALVQKGALSTAEVCEALGLTSLKGRKWHVQAAIAIRGEGLYEGLDWWVVLTSWSTAIKLTIAAYVSSLTYLDLDVFRADWSSFHLKVRTLHCSTANHRPRSRMAVRVQTSLNLSLQAKLPQNSVGGIWVNDLGQLGSHRLQMCQYMCQGQQMSFLQASYVEQHFLWSNLWCFAGYLTHCPRWWGQGKFQVLAPWGVEPILSGYLVAHTYISQSST